MSENEQAGQSPVEEGTSLRDAAAQISGLLNEDGHFNPDGQMSRAHPDYDESEDPRANENARPRNEKGQFAKKAQTEETEFTDDQLAADDQLGDEEGEDTDLTEDGDTDEPQDQSATEDTDADQEDTGEPIQSLEELAEALEMSTDDLKKELKVSFRAAGEDMTVTLDELQRGYQKDVDYRKGTTKITEDRRALDLDTQNRMEQFERANQDAATALMATQQIFENMLNHPDMQNLRNTDAAEWNARRTELGEQIQYIQGVRQQAAQRYQQFQNEQLTQLKAREEGYLKEKKADFGQQDVQTARQVMESIGYTPDETKQIFDHRLVLAALEMSDLRSEVQALRAEKEKATQTAKRVKKQIPKMQRPGKQQHAGNASIQRDTMTRLKKRFNQTRNVKDAAKVIEQML